MRWLPGCLWGLVSSPWELWRGMYEIICSVSCTRPVCALLGTCMAFTHQTHRTAGTNDKRTLSKWSFDQRFTATIVQRCAPPDMGMIPAMYRPAFVLTQILSRQSDLRFRTFGCFLEPSLLRSQSNGERGLYLCAGCRKEGNHIKEQ